MGLVESLLIKKLQYLKGSSLREIKKGGVFLHGLKALSLKEIGKKIL